VLRAAESGSRTPISGPPGQGGPGTGGSYYELYLPKSWFGDDYAQLRRRWHIPEDRTFGTKPQIGLEMIRRAKEGGLPFAVVGCDSLYGRDAQFRADLDAEGVIYMADVPEDTRVYLEKPILGVPKTPPGRQGRPFCRARVLNKVKPVEARKLVSHLKTVWHLGARPGGCGLLPKQERCWRNGSSKRTMAPSASP